MEINEVTIKRILDLIHKRVVDKWATLPLSLFPYEEDYVEYYEGVYNFLNKELSISDREGLNKLFMLFVVNYNEDGDYDEIDNADITERDLLDMFGPHIMGVSHFFGVTPFLIEEGDFQHWYMDVVYVHTINEWFAVGDERQLKRSKYQYSEDRWSDESEVLDILGVETYLSFCFVGDSDKRMLSIDISNMREQDMKDEDVIEFLRFYSTDIDQETAFDIVERYDEVAEQWGELPASADDAKYLLEMRGLVYEGRDEVRNIIYNNNYVALSDNDDLIEWLIEYGYVGVKNGKPNIDREQYRRLPKWLKFDWEDFHEDDVMQFDWVDMSPYGWGDYFKYNGDIYYILKIDY